MCDEMQPVTFFKENLSLNMSLPPVLLNLKC